MVKEPAPKYGSISPDEYLEMEEATQERLEYYNGQVIPLDIVTVIHNDIQHNISNNLGSFLDGMDYRRMGTRMRIGTPSRQHYMFSDGLIVSGKPKFEKSKYDTVINPSVIIEIRSPFIGGINKKRKLHYYKEIPTLKEYIIVDSQKCEVEVARRRSETDWPFEVINDREETLFIETIGYHLPLPKIYRHTGL